MAHSNKQTELKSTEEDSFEMRRSFSWDREFFTSDGFLDADELSSMIEGGSDDVNHQLQRIEEIETLEAELFQEIGSSTQKSTKTSKSSSSRTNLPSRKTDSQAKKVSASSTAPLSSSKTIKTAQTRRSSLGNRVKSPARRSTSSKTGKSASDSPSKTSSGITTKNKVAPVNTTRVSRTAPASPGSSGSSSSSTTATFFANQRSKRSSSVPRRSSVNREKPSAVNARRNDETKITKPAVSLIPKTHSSISLKIKPPPVISHPSPSLRSYNSSSSSSASSCTADQRSKSKGSNKDSTVNHRSKSSLKNRPSGQAPDRSGKQPAVLRRETGSSNASKTRKRLAPKTVAAVNTGLKPVSQKSAATKASGKQSSAKAKLSGGVSRDVENIIVVSNPEVLDIKGKLNALKMEISMQKKDRCKETKMSHDESGKGESGSVIQMNNKTKSK